VTSRSPVTAEQDTPSNPKNGVRATVTGVDSGDQLFRDNARVVFLKGQKCIYQSKFKPSPGSSVMIELRNGPEPWRSNAKVRAVSNAGAEPGSYRVTLELDRAHSAVIEEADDDIAPPAKAIASESDGSPDAPSETPETAVPDFSPPPAPVPIPAPAHAPTPASKAALADVVRSVMAAEAERWKRQLQSAIGGQVETALRQPLQALEANIERRMQKQPAMTEETVRKIAAHAAENAQIEWATTSQKIVAEAVRSAMAAEGDQQRRELRALVSGEIEAAWKAQLAARVDDAAKKTAEARIEEHSRKRSSLTEETVRQLAAQVAQGIQLEWASTKLQKMIAEAVRAAIASESAQRRAEATAMITGEIEAALRGPFAARMDVLIDKSVAKGVEQYFQTPAAIGALQKLTAEAARAAVASESPQRRAETTAMVSGEIEAALRGPFAARVDALMDETVAKGIEQYFQTSAAMGALRKLAAEAVRQPLDAEYEQRGRQVQAVVSHEIEAAVRGPIASQMDEMLRGALEAQRAEYLRNPPPITEDTIRRLTASVAQHPQLQASMDALSATLTDRWTEIVRGATANAQQDINSRVAATERLTGEVVSEIQHKLNSFSAEINRIRGNQDAASESPSEQPSEPEQDKRFGELLQSTGSHFEREMKAALQKIFGKS
jgi:uncharacterized protein YneF (UPF0154 family)